MSRRPPIGARGRRFTIELPQETPDGFGGIFRSWQAGPQVWGAIEHLGASDKVRGGRLEAIATHRVTLPFREGIGPEQRLALGVRRFRIRQAGDPDGRRERLDCLVEEIAA